MKRSYMVKIISGILSLGSFNQSLLAQQIEIDTKIGRNYLLSDVSNKASSVFKMGFNFFANRKVYFISQYSSGMLRGTVAKGTFFQNNYQIYEVGIGLNLDSLFRYNRLLTESGYRMSFGLGQINNEVSYHIPNSSYVNSFRQPAFTYYIQGSVHYAISPEINLQTALQFHFTQSNILDGAAGSEYDHIFSLNIGFTYKMKRRTPKCPEKAITLYIPPDSSTHIINERLDRIDSTLTEIRYTVSKQLATTPTITDTTKNEIAICFPVSRYYVILGGYLNILPAIAEKNRFMQDGVATRLISKSAKSSLVLISCFESNNLREALMMMKFFRVKINKEAWIYVNLNHNQL